MQNGLNSAESFTKKIPFLSHMANMIENDIFGQHLLALDFFVQRFDMNRRYEMYTNAKCRQLSLSFDVEGNFAIRQNRLSDSNGQAT